MIIQIPIIVSVIGIIIHFLGIVNILKLAPLKADIIMFIIDLLVAYGLLRRKKWGWYLAIILYLQQSILQPYWAYQRYIFNFFVYHPFLEYFVPPFLVVLSLIILIKYKNIYTKTK